MKFAVKCSKHYPGFEQAHAPNVDLLKSQFVSWNGCGVDTSAIIVLPDGEFDDELKEKLKVWTDEFTSKH